MIEATCHCGAVRIEVPSAPEAVTSCNCSICRRTGALLAYYAPKAVRVIPESGATDIYMWGDREIEFHRCKVCGNFTHWLPVDKTLDRMGVNARLMAPEVLAAARVRHFDGAATWTFLDE
ncbi:MAG: GFA family protein [Pseudomonadota bacterium]|nr:GFA family protein [Pseudomonadota bacterium]